MIAERAFGQEAEGYCRRPDPGENLVVRVRNQGNKSIFRHSTVLVVFNPGGPREGNARPIGSGDFTDVKFEIPTGWFDPDGDFKITVDANNDINETNEDNNGAVGICKG